MKICTNTTGNRVAVFLGALLLSWMCFSAQENKESIFTRCENVYSALNGLLDDRGFAPCASDIRYAGWVIEGAAALIRTERYQPALEDLKFADKSLSKINSKSSGCTYFSLKVKPSMHEVRELISELEKITA